MFVKVEKTVNYNAYKDYIDDILSQGFNSHEYRPGLMVLVGHKQVGHN